MHFEIQKSVKKSIHTIRIAHPSTLKTKPIYDDEADVSQIYCHNIFMFRSITETANDKNMGNDWF